MEIEDNGYYNLNTNGVQLLPVRVNVSATGSRLQDNKKVVITNNGTSNIVPDEGYDGMKSVTTEVNVESDVKVQDSKEITITQNGNDTVVPDTGYNGIASVFIKTQVPAPVSQDVKSVTYTENGEYTVIPDESYSTMKSVDVIVNTPVITVQNNREYSIINNGNIIINPSDGYSAMSKVSISSNVTSRFDINGYYVDGVYHDLVDEVVDGKLKNNTSSKVFAIYRKSSSNQTRSGVVLQPYVLTVGETVNTLAGCVLGSYSSGTIHLVASGADSKEYFVIKVTPIEDPGGFDIPIGTDSVYSCSVFGVN